MDHTPGFLKIVNDAKKNVRELTVAQVAEKLMKGDKFHFGYRNVYSMDGGIRGWRSAELPQEKSAK